MFPYADIAFIVAETIMPSDDVAVIEANQPGFTTRKIAMRSSEINAQLRKRYGNAPTAGNSLPWGRVAPALVASGTNPPNVTMQGVPILGSQLFTIQIQVAGMTGDGASSFRWSKDGGITWSTPTTVQTSVVLPGTGVTAQFPTGASFATDNLYQSDTCVPRIILSWVNALVTMDLYNRRGRNPQDPAIVTVTAEYEKAQAQIKQAADSKDGLFDLPVSEDLDSAVTTAGVLSHSDASPYVAMYEGDYAGMRQDYNGRCPYE